MALCSGFMVVWVELNLLALEQMVKGKYYFCNFVRYELRSFPVVGNFGI